jgi:hypothetical protein
MPASATTSAGDLAHYIPPVDLSKAVDALLDAARQHGDKVGNDQEIGDLQALLHAAWALMTAEQRSRLLRTAEASKVVDAAFGVRLFMNEDDVLETDWQRTCAAFGLDDSFQYSPDQVLDAVNMERLTALASADEQVDRYVYGFWPHIFGRGQRETITRLVFDRTRNCLAFLQLKAGPGPHDWFDANRDQLADVEDSLKNANSEAIDKPRDWNLSAASDLPAWAIRSQELMRPAERPRMNA